MPGSPGPVEASWEHQDRGNGGDTRSQSCHTGWAPSLSWALREARLGQASRPKVMVRSEEWALPPDRRFPFKSFFTHSLTPGPYKICLKDLVMAGGEGREARQKTHM